MRRHSTDLVGLIFGTAFVIAGVGFLVRETTDRAVDPVWTTGLGLMLLGAIALIATVARGVNREHDEPLPVASSSTTPLPVTPDEPEPFSWPESFRSPFSSED
jgi:hypothetical protein